MKYTEDGSLNILKSDAFRIHLISLPNVMLFAQTVDLPGTILGEALVPNPNIDYAEPGDKLDFENFILTFMVDEHLVNYLEVMDWMFGLGFPRHTQEFKNIKEGDKYNEVSDIKIELLTNKSNYNTEITMVNAFPISLSSIQLSYVDIQPSHPTASVEFQYQYFYYGKQHNDYLNIP